MDDVPSILRKKVDDLKKAKKFEEAIQLIDEVEKIKLEEKSPDFWYKKGIRFCEFGEYEKAIDCFDKDLTLHEKSYNSFFAKGVILLLMKKYAESVECFNKAAEEHHLNHLQNVKKADQLKKVRKYEKALLYTDLASDEKPLDDVFWYYKGTALLKLKKFDFASDCLTKALTINKDNSKAMYNLAKCELLSGNEEKCLSVLEQTCVLDHITKEKLKVDADFFPLSDNKKFRLLVGL